MTDRNPLQHWRFWRHEPHANPPGTTRPGVSSGGPIQRNQGPHYTAAPVDAPETAYPADSYQQFAQQPSHEHFRVGGVSGYGESPGPRLVGSGMLLGQEGGWSGSHEDWLSYPKSSSEAQFRGYGPKGYERSAERLREIICERLTDDPAVDARDISVQITGNTVTLEGTVPHRGMKYRAEDVVANSGVDDIVNHLRVRRES